MPDMLELMAAQYAKPDPNPYLFQIGQTVRLRKGRSNDGQTSRAWDGAIVTVIDRYCTGMFKDHWYKLRLASGAINEFKEYEIDARYARINGSANAVGS